MDRIISGEGCQLRMNISIKAECSFAQVKQDMNFIRFMRQGQSNVLAERNLLAIARTQRNCSLKSKKYRIGKHLFKLKKSE